MRSFTRVFLMVLLCMIGLHTAQAKTEKVYATFENPSNTNTTWNAETKTFTWSTTYYNQLRNIGLPTGDITKYKKLVVDCEIKSGDQFRILFYKGGSNKTLYASNGVNEFILADTLKALYPDDFNEFLLQCDEICLSGNNAVAPGEAVINAVYLETYDDEGEKVYATFENPSNTNTTWNAETKTFTWSTTYYNQLRNIGLPNGDITKYKKLVVDCEIKSGDQFRVLFYKGGSNKTLYASNGVNEFILADTLKALYPDDYNEFLLQCDEICLSGNNAVAPGEAVINAVYLETYPENESVEIPDITYEEDPGKPAGEFVDFTEAFPALQPRIGLGTDGHPIVLGNGEVVVGQRTKDVIADLSDYSKLTIVTSPNLKLVVYMNHEVDAQQNAGDYSEDDAGKYVFLDIQANENGIAEIDLTQYDKQDLNCICLPWDNNNKGTVWYLLLTAKPAAEDVLPIDIQFGADYNDAAISAYNKTWTATKDGKTWTLVNFNNNNNGWSSVKCGSKNAASVASITSPAINAVVKNYVVSVASAASVNSAKLTIMNGDEKVGEDIDITANFVAGDVNVPVEGQKGYSYVLTIDNAQASKNGSVEITKIALYGEGQYVDVHIANTIEDPYTVAKAFELIDAGQALNEVVFVKGIISKIDSINADQAFITYWISADGTAEGQQLQCYKGKTLEGLALADIEVGAEVIVKGNLKKYGETYEFDANNEIAAYKVPVKPLFADGKYYLLNKGTGKYLAGGASWGTHAVVNADGLDYGIAFVDGKYTLDSQVSNGGNNHFLNGEWNDGAAMGWIFTPVEGAEGLYTISNGTNFLTAGEDGVVVLAEDGTVEAAHWTLVTKADRDAANLATLGAATAENGVDATFLITGANYNRNDLRNAAWTGDGFGVGGDATNTNAEKWGGNSQTFDIHQTIELPNGIYKVTWNGFYRYNNTNENTNDVAVAAHAEGTEVINSFVYLNDKDFALTSIADEAATAALQALDKGIPFSQGDASFAFANGVYEQSAEIIVTEDTLTIGIKKIEHLGTDWTVWDNFRLTYYGVAVNPDKDEIAVPEGKVNLIANGNLAGDDVTSFVAKEYPSADILPATIVAGAGENNSRGIVVKAGDDTENAKPLAWDSQFWISFNQALPVGTKLHVEFDYAASQAAKGSTQAHGEPGAYQHWAAIGDVNFTTEWQHFSTDIEVSADMAGANGMKSVAFNLQEEKTATDYFFDNFGVWAEIPEPVQEWENIIVNSDMEGESMECFYVTEQGVGGPYVAVATEGIGKDGSKAVKVQSADSPANNWDTQFFIRLPYQLPAGTQYKVSFDYKADKAGDFETQAHANPGQYIHWACCGSGSFTTDWQTYTAEGAIPSECDGTQADGGFLKIFQSIAFNLALNKAATQFIFDNVKFFVPKDIVSSLTKNPDENPVHYPTGIQTVNTEKNAEGIFNLNGQKVMKTQKGLYIMNGKKVVIK